MPSVPVPISNTATQWSPPQLGTSLRAAVEIDAIWRDARTLPELSDADRTEARNALQIYEAMPRGSSPATISKMMGSTALGFPPRQLGDREADTRLRLYQANLADIHEEVLKAAFGMAIRESTFFPTVAELRAFARRVPTPRRFIVMRRLKLLLAHDPAPEIQDDDLVTSEQLQGLIARLGGSLAA